MGGGGLIQYHTAWTVQCGFFMNGHGSRLLWLAVRRVTTDDCRFILGFAVTAVSPGYHLLKHCCMCICICVSIGENVCDGERKCVRAAECESVLVVLGYMCLSKGGLVTSWTVGCVCLKAVALCPAVVLQMISHSLWLRRCSLQLWLLLLTCHVIRGLVSSVNT